MDSRALILTPDESLANRLTTRFRHRGAIEVAHFTDVEALELTSHLDLSAYFVTVIDERFAGTLNSTGRFIRDFKRKNEYPLVGMVRSPAPQHKTLMLAAGCNFCVLCLGSEIEKATSIGDLMDEIDGVFYRLFE